MSARRYRVSAEVGPLSDREVDALADLLWDNGAGEIAFTPLTTWRKALADHYSRADSTRDRDALRDALQHETQVDLKW